MQWTPTDIYRLRLDHQQMMQSCGSIVELNQVKQEISDNLASIRSNLTNEQVSEFNKEYESADKNVLNEVEKANALGVAFMPEQEKINWPVLFIVVAFFGYMAFS